MNSNVKIAVLTFSAVSVGLGLYFYHKQPNGKIIINPDGSGSVSLGNRTQTFGPMETGVVKSWNNYTLSGSKDKLQLTQGKKTLEEGKMTQYDEGTSRVAIDNNFNYGKQVKVDKAVGLIINAQNPILGMFTSNLR